MIINRQTVRCDIKDCNEEYTIKENLAWGAKPNFIHLPSGWKNFVTFFGSFHICPKHEVVVKIDGEDWG